MNFKFISAPQTKQPRTAPGYFGLCKENSILETYDYLRLLESIKKHINCDISYNYLNMFSSNYSLGCNFPKRKPLKRPSNLSDANLILEWGFFNYRLFGSRYRGLNQLTGIT